MLITSRTPLRVSFFGGGTDYPEYYKLFPGAVVGMTINKYVYVSALKLATYIHYKYRLSYSRLETVDEIGQVQHPVVRSVLRHYKIDDALDISIMADMPASSGLGSSSAFTVGLRTSRARTVPTVNSTGPLTRRRLTEGSKKRFDRSIISKGTLTS